jgi:DNA-directed RNA polymerase beta' subunit
MLRSVITGDARLKINEVGIPKMHARNLEIPEVVTEQNRSRLLTYYLNGKDRYPGCHRIIKKADGHIYRIELMDKNYVPQIGDTILRDLITGDYVNFNRQPSLLFSNISGMRAVVMETGKTLRIHVSSCSAFNADFDGDYLF